jgi:hypothetical protein
LHGYILVGLTEADIVPSSPTAATLAVFRHRWEPDFICKLKQRLHDTSSSDVGASQLVADLCKKVLEDAKKGNNTAKNILQVEDAFLTIIFSKLLAFRLEAWHPDLMSPVDSYATRPTKWSTSPVSVPLLHLGGVFFLVPSMSGIKNNQLIFDIYCSFTFSYMKHKVKVEMRSLGKLLEDKDNNNSSRHQKRVFPIYLIFALFLTWGLR